MSHHVVMLADHNSIITPGVDLEKITPHDEVPAAATTREQELELKGEIGVGDAWKIAYTPTDDPEAHHIPKGWTWGFPIEQNQNKPDRREGDSKDIDELDAFRNRLHRRRIDRVHLSKYILPALTKCYTHFVAHSNHKAVIVMISPPSLYVCRGTTASPNLLPQK